MALALDQKKLVMKLREVKKAGGCLDDLVKQFSPAEPESEQYDKDKLAISQRITNIRAAMKKECEKLDIDVARVDVLVPTFRDNRSTSNRKVLAELFDVLNTEYEENLDEESDEFDENPENPAQ